MVRTVVRWVFWVSVFLGSLWVIDAFGKWLIQTY